MVIELRWRWPLIRRVKSPVVSKATGMGSVMSPNAHRSWVSTPLGLGWLHHHEEDGWAVEYQNGEVRKHRFEEVQNVSPPGAGQ